VLIRRRDGLIRVCHDGGAERGSVNRCHLHMPAAQLDGNLAARNRFNLSILGELADGEGRPVDAPSPAKLHSPGNLRILERVGGENCSELWRRRVVAGKRSTDGAGVV
jgi:hypothetical protein